jgi:hypothetical protein
MNEFLIFLCQARKYVAQNKPYEICWYEQKGIQNEKITNCYASDNL